MVTSSPLGKMIVEPPLEYSVHLTDVSSLYVKLAARFSDDQGGAGLASQAVFEKIGTGAVGVVLDDQVVDTALAGAATVAAVQGGGLIDLPFPAQDVDVVTVIGVL